MLLLAPGAFTSLLWRNGSHIALHRYLLQKDYLPIVLSGIVQSSDNAAVTTKLEVGWQFHLPYKTREGDMASFAIATGTNVSVNTILGFPFQVATGMVIYLVDNVVECKSLDCPPFTIDF